MKKKVVEDKMRRRKMKLTSKMTMTIPAIRTREMQHFETRIIIRNRKRCLVTFHITVNVDLIKNWTSRVMWHWD